MSWDAERTQREIAQMSAELTRRDNRRHALHCAALWLSSPDGGVVAAQVVETARVFEHYLNEIENRS
jgi:hypothetical protein